LNDVEKRKEIARVKKDSLWITKPKEKGRNGSPLGPEERGQKKKDTKSKI